MVPWIRWHLAKIGPINWLHSDRKHKPWIWYLLSWPNITIAGMYLTPPGWWWYNKYSSDTRQQTYTELFSPYLCPLLSPLLSVPLALSQYPGVALEVRCHITVGWNGTCKGRESREESYQHTVFTHSHFKLLLSLFWNLMHLLFPLSTAITKYSLIWCLELSYSQKQLF